MEANNEITDFVNSPGFESPPVLLLDDAVQSGNAVLCAATVLAHPLILLTPARTRALSASSRRALQIRVDALSAEQRRDAEEVEYLYARSNALTLQILERQQRLRRLREILLNGRPA